MPMICFIVAIVAN
jgi:hypothetical protein